MNNITYKIVIPSRIADYKFQYERVYDAKEIKGIADNLISYVDQNGNDQSIVAPLGTRVIKIEDCFASLVLLVNGPLLPAPSAHVQSLGRATRRSRK